MGHAIKTPSNYLAKYTTKSVSAVTAASTLIPVYNVDPVQRVGRCTCLICWPSVSRNEIRTRPEAAAAAGGAAVNKVAMLLSCEGDTGTLRAEQALLINHRIFTGSDLIKSHRITGYIIHGPGIYTAELTCHLPQSASLHP